MKVNLYFTSQFCGSFNKEIEIPDNSTDEYIKSLFPEEMGLEYDENCYFKKL